ncbi:hypothetical protein HZS_3199 [Henneguya salminicola]|nr:hypothetical protein HZS_3199 [Henneguya salminicola]
MEYLSWNEESNKQCSCCYNRRLNDFFANAHPSICSFVEIIKNGFLYFEERYAEVRLNSYSVAFFFTIHFDTISIQ